MSFYDDIRQLIRFAGVGILTFAVGIGVTALVHEVLRQPEELGAAISLVVLLFLGFFLSRNFTFSSTGRVRHQAWKFLFVAGAMRGFEYLLFLTFFSILGLNYLIALALGLGISFFAKFILYRNWIFADTVPKPNNDEKYS